MAKRKPSKPLETHIKELEAAVRELHDCAACGNPIAADATTCPHCGTPVREAVELREKATESLNDLERQLAETGPEPPPPTSLSSESPPRRGLESVADVVAAVEVPRSAPAPDVQIAEVVPEPAPEVAPEGEESENLEGFIAGIEAEVGPGGEEPATARPPVAAAQKATVRAVPRAAPAARSNRWVAPASTGLVIYVLSLFLLAILDRLVVVSFMLIATVLVLAGIRARPVAAAGPGRGPPPSATEYVCPLCGTEIPARATQCPTCGAVFEE
jgi:predicted RNA-binding Zn-ribbon protein involved in translation (DUF1610 family)